MRGIALSLPAKFRFKQIYPMASPWGTVSTTTPRELVEDNGSKEAGAIGNGKTDPIVAFSRPPPELVEDNGSKEAGAIGNGKTDPIVAFSRPPPIPPFLGPLVALSLLEMWSGRDNDDN